MPPSAGKDSSGLQKSGTYEFSTRGTGNATITLDGKTVLNKASASKPDVRDVLGFPIPRRTVAVELEAGRGYPIRIDYVTGQTPYEYLSFGIREPLPAFEEAVAAARDADAAVVFVGSSSTTEGEGYDRTSLDLPGDQNKLVEAVIAANPKTAVVVNAGAAMTMPWADKAPAIVDMWLPGEGGAAALANILTGKVNPSGKLPVTFPVRTEDDSINLKGAKTPYSEGLLVGYRGYVAKDVKPLFAFGHGLSYTRFTYSGLSGPARIKGSAAVPVRVTLRNDGAVAGKEVVQFYVAPLAPAAGDPPIALRGFAKVDLASKARKTVAVTLDPRAFSRFDVDSGAWRVVPGRYRIMAGSSSADIRQVREIEVTAD
jgi:beta-glucosidase